MKIFYYNHVFKYEIFNSRSLIPLKIFLTRVYYVFKINKFKKPAFIYLFILILIKILNINNP